ncbi:MULTISPECIES: BMP family ABC transporter substrate-binding protein [unclassified Clostridium]|uniref:BMP family ABC transporter substrate-binding protein n=1 Tax=unclassified Clostridium TaxID=2614128 RepID=UPI00290F8D83|nr:BMP family ABC transporter substrate-binding protein [Clostridium sp.]MDU5107193.1 BMP family ABC transporter substrate-binding protein [Clostridium sp.]
MKKTSYSILIASVFLILFSVVSINFINNKKLKNQSKKPIKIAVVFTGSGLGDKSFNDLIYDGLLRAQEELNIEFDYAEPIHPEKYKESILEFVKTMDYQLIIAVGPEQEGAVKAVSNEYPNQKFTLIDSKLDMKNISSIYTRWEEQAFLNGVIAGLLSKMEYEKTGNINKAGVVLGMEVSHLREGAVGFEAGYKYIFPEGEVITAVVNDFRNPLKAKEISLLMYSKGAKYIQHLAGASGLGVFAAAKESEAYAFGVDENQNYFDPSVIIATSTRYINEIVFNEIKYIKDNSWNDGVHYSGLKEGIIDITREGSEVELDPSIMKIVKDIKYKIVKEQLYIPKTKEELNSWINENKYITN